MSRFVLVLAGLATQVALAQPARVPAPAPTGAADVPAPPVATPATADPIPDPGETAPKPGDEPTPEPAPETEPAPVEPVEPAPAYEDSPSCLVDGCEDPLCDVPCDDCGDGGWLSSILDRKEPLLADYRNKPLFDDPCDCCDDGWYYSVGGEFRYRYMDERNRLRPQGTLRPSNYHLTRFTPWIEVGNDWIKGYARGIDARITGEDIPLTPIDENQWDMLEYYVDAKLGELNGSPLRVRYGRQMLLYGDQHLISPLGWANTFRNFEGVKGYVRGDTWDFDGFATQAVNGAAGAPFRPTSFDQKDESRWLSGIYATYKEAPKGNLDLFWIWTNENEPVANRQDGDRHTIGGRYYGKHAIAECDDVVQTYFWDLQGGYQFGRDVFGGPVSQDVSAYFVNAKAGTTFDSVAWTPSIFGLFWYGSGDDDPNDGTINTYYSLYPLGHAYWGIIDNFSGQNLIDYSIQGSVKPADKLTLVTAYHWFDKANTNDFVYNIVGAPLGPAGADKHIGNELDVIATYQFNPNLQLQLGYSWFWYGDAINQTALNRPDAHQFYTMATWGF